MTVWYEICTIEQLRNVSAKSDDEPMAEGIVTLQNLPGSPPITVLPGERKLEFLKRVEMSTGISMRKSGPRFYTLQKHDISYPSTAK